ncbi:hypothetical protein DSO57_1033602 [Entomophthora muscae]|uniref:Uncharacterized protein n=1 Tax=Entomophthora muscae TaxID=34485 RepID=A0ACC2U9L7_9FUNG|nr:hypothetical protein DSO57_1033602 [Entomophthora muscae]
MSSLLNFERTKFGVLCVETNAARKEVPTTLLDEAWASLEVTKTVPAKSLVEVKAAFEELYSNYFAKEGTPVQGNRIYAWDAWNLLVGWDEILQQVKEMANCGIEALRAQEEKSVEIMARWRDDNKVLSKKIASLETKLLEASSQEGNSNKSQGQDNGRMDWLSLDLSQDAYLFEASLSRLVAQLGPIWQPALESIPEVLKEACFLGRICQRASYLGWDAYLFEASLSRLVAQLGPVWQL